MMSHRPRPRPGVIAAAAVVCLTMIAPAAAVGQGGFTLEQIKSNPFPTDLTAAASGSRIAWVFFEKGVRNVYVAEGPSFAARKLTPYTDDDGQEITNLSISDDGKMVVYTRGGDHGSNWEAPGNLQPDPNSSPMQQFVEIWAVPFDGGAPKKLATGDDPVIAPTSDRVAYTVNGQIFSVPIDGSAAGKRMFFSRGENGDPAWSPDGKRLAFVTNRGDHAFIGIFAGDDQPLLYLAPTTNRDFSPRWSPDGSRIAYVRVRGQGGAPEPLLQLRPNPWQIWTADTRTGDGKMVWASPNTLHGSYPTTQGQSNLHWMAGDRLAFLADLDGWEHLYSIPVAGGRPLLLTPGKFMCEYISASPDGKWLLYSANTGPEKQDFDRRHVFKVPVDAASPTQLVPGTGLEWTPFVTGDMQSIAFIGATYQQPPLPHVVPFAGGASQTLAQDRVPADFPASQLILPKSVSFRAADGVLAHGQLFEPPGVKPGEKRPAVIFVHGGPPRQMLAGWHYSYYYSNGYSMNQYMASRGWVVLAVNYRLGIGYGHDFHHPAHAGPWGASEYRDIKAAGLYLKGLPGVDGTRIGIWGGSYGGFLTAMALSRNSDIFAAGVDIHGVHDWTSEGGSRLGANRWRYEPGDLEAAKRVAWASSPVSAIATWRSPVLLIQGDDDRNVHFHETVDLARRLAAKGVDYEEMVIPDEIHDFLRYISWMRVDSATAAYLDRKLHGGTP